MAERSREVPEIKISQLDDDQQRDLQVVKVDLRRQAPASLEVRFNNESGEYGKVDGPLASGGPITVKAGFLGGEPKPIFHGEILSGVVSGGGSDTRTFTARSFDLMYRMTGERKTRTFLEQKFLDVFSTIAGDHGLSPDTSEGQPSTDITSLKRDYIIQHNQTDLDFLRGLAGWFDFDLCIDHTQDSSKTLRFRAPQVGADAVVTAAYNAPPTGGLLLRRFDISQTLSRVVEKVIVRGWNPGDKAEIVGEASGSLYDDMGDTPSTSMVSGQSRQVTDYKPFTIEEANFVAKCKLNEYARTFLRAEMEVTGDARLQPGFIIEVTEVGDKFDGKYFIEEATHVFRSKVSDASGYITRLVASRCGW